MYERFTESARRVIVRAAKEARSRGAAEVGTEHLLAAVLAEQQALATLLARFELSIERVRGLLPDVVEPGQEPAAGRAIGFTARSKSALEHALRESQALKIGPDDILLGLLRVDDGGAMQLLLALEVPVEPLLAAVRGVPVARERSAPAEAAALRDEPVLEDVATVRRLTAQEEVDLARRIESGDAGAKQAMVECNLHLVPPIAEDFREGRLPFLELVQHGTVGLVRAAETYDHRAGHRFSEHAARWVRQAIARAAIGARR